MIAGKRKWSSRSKTEDAQRGFRGWHERGYLPHRDEPGLTQFVTFRVADSFPRALRSEWEHLWQIEDDRARRTELEAYLDQGKGKCFLRQPEIAKLTEEAFQHFHGQRYDLLAWCIMPNHVHVLFKVGEVPMSEIIWSWKSYTGQKANALLKRRGSFWAEDYWDTYMRDADQQRKTVHYIENNPAKAKLLLNPKQWLWGSARLRNDFGELTL